jgi:hypothetical protein
MRTFGMGQQMHYRERARKELAQAMNALVETLACARALAMDGVTGPELATLLERAGRELEIVDEKLLILDRYRQRSLFKHAERLRGRLDGLYDSVSHRVASAAD